MDLAELILFLRRVPVTIRSREVNYTADSLYEYAQKVLFKPGYRTPLWQSVIEARLDITAL
jgi:hypothetical protein